MEFKNNMDKSYDDKINLFVLWRIIWNGKKLLVLIVSVSIIITIIISFIITPIYRATTSIIVLASRGNIIGITNAATVASMQFSETSDDIKRVLAVLNSRTIREHVVKKLNLDDVFIKKSFKNERLKFLKAVVILDFYKNVSYDKGTGLISISVDHEDPELTEKIANAFVEELQNILISKSFSVSRMKREFIQEQLKDIEKKMNTQQDELSRFQKKSKLIKPSEQTEATMKLYSSLIEKKTSFEVELNRIKDAMAPDNSMVVSLKNQIASIDSKIRKLETGNNSSPLPSLSGIPDKLVKFEKLEQDLNITKSTYETLLKQFEQYKLEEAQEGLFVQIIDPAIEPMGRIKPNRNLMVVTSVFLSFIVAVLLLLILDSIRRKDHPIF